MASRKQYLYTITYVPQLKLYSHLGELARLFLYCKSESEDMDYSEENRALIAKSAMSYGKELAIQILAIQIFA